MLGQNSSGSPVTSPLILLVDDDQEILVSLRRSLEIGGIDGVNWKDCYTFEDARDKIAKAEPAVVILDLFINSDEPNGLILLDEIVHRYPASRVIMLTGAKVSALGVEGIRRGAANFVQKPVDPIHLAALVKDGLIQAQLRREHSNMLQVRNDAWGSILVGNSPEIELARETAKFASLTKQPVLIVGETGVGKGVCAQALHKLGDRSGGRFVPYLPGGSSADLVMSDLFGHTRGSFTGAAAERKGLLVVANGGTLFLDEIDEFPPQIQVMLLGPLQDGRFRAVGSDSEVLVDVRIIAATNRPLSELLAKGKLRSDLYHRIAHLTITIPSLRERPEDIPLVAGRVLDEVLLRFNGFRPAISSELEEHLVRQCWPGNIRQLRAALEHACLRAQIAGRNVLLKEDTPSFSEQPAALIGKRGSLAEQLHETKVAIIGESLQRNQGNISAVARELDIDRDTVRRVLARNSNDTSG